MHRIRLKQPWTAEWVSQSAEPLVARYQRRFNASPGVLNESQVDLFVKLTRGSVQKISLNGQPLDLDSDGLIPIRTWLQPSNVLVIDVEGGDLLSFSGEVELQIHG